jgi:hypothetical protein
MNFYQIDGTFDFYVLITATETSKIKSAKLYVKYKLDVGMWKPYAFWVYMNDVQLIKQTPTSEGPFTITLDVTGSIRPRAMVETGTMSNKVSFKIGNSNYFYWGYCGHIEDAYLEIEYTAETPTVTPTTPTTTEEKTGITGMEDIDAMVTTMMQFMMMFMMMSMMMSIMTSMTETFKEAA